jgi:hypothetical protein
MVIYSLKYASDGLKKDPVKLVSKKDEDAIALTRQVIDEAKKYIALYVESISGGVFPLSQRENREKIVCQYCGLKAICRVSEAK